MFNPEARWDRNLPQQESQDELLNEPISVSCLFDKGQAQPRYFIWKNRLFRVKKINFFWQERQGRAILSYFSLDTTSGTYQVSFSNIDLTWQIDRIINLEC